MALSAAQVNIFRVKHISGPKIKRRAIACVERLEIRMSRLDSFTDDPSSPTAAADNLSLIV
jgi:hypothetical protein